MRDSQKNLGEKDQVILPSLTPTLRGKQLTAREDLSEYHSPATPEFLTLTLR